MRTDALIVQSHCAAIDWTALEALFEAAALGGRQGAKLRRAFENSTAVRFLLEGGRLVGAARALSDREYHATLYDVVVHPDWQRRGLGTRLVRDLLSELPVWRVLLVADAEAAPFYRRLGFEPLGTVLARFDDTRLFDPS